MTVTRPTRSTRPTRLRPVRPRGWWLDVLMVLGLVVVTVALTWQPLLDLDLAVLHWVDDHRPPAADVAADVVNRLGQGGALTIIALVLAALLARRRRSLWPFAPVAAAFLATGVVLLPLKLYFHRAFPHADLPDEVKVRLFSDPDNGMAYPSGHAVNTIVWYGVIVLLAAAWFAARPRLWAAMRFLPPVLVGFTATYLGYHWLTDMLAGLCIGVLLDRLLTRTPWPGFEPRTPPTNTHSRVHESDT